MKTVAEWGDFYIDEDKEQGIFVLLKNTGRGFSQEVYRSSDYWRTENKLVALAW